MMTKAQNLLLFFTALAAVVVLCAMEVAGLLLAIGYSVVSAVCVLLALYLAVPGISTKYEGKRPPYALITLPLCAVLLILGLTIGSISSSPRNHFYLLSKTIIKNQSLDSVKAQFAGYESWTSPEPDTQCCHLTFRYTKPSTMDVVVIHYDPNTNRVLDASYSSD